MKTQGHAFEPMSTVRTDLPDTRPAAEQHPARVAVENSLDMKHEQLQIALHVKLYCLASLIILALTSALKIHDALSDAAFLAQPDPVFDFLTIRQTMSFAATLEALIIVLFLRTRSYRTTVAALLWLGSLLVTYRVAMFLLGVGLPCKCLGHFGELTGLSARSVNMLAQAILLWLTIPSLLIMRIWRLVYVKAISP